MKSLICILVATFLNIHNVEETALSGHKLTMQEAERILGESCQLKESGSYSENGGHTYKSIYVANSSDEKSDKMIALYFMFESYGDENAAKKIFETLKASNQTHPEFETMNNLGDEAFFHSDAKNFISLLLAKATK